MYIEIGKSKLPCACFTGETPVLTADGLQQIASITNGTEVTSVPDFDIKQPRSNPIDPSLV